MSATTDRWVVRYTSGSVHEWHLFELVSVDNANRRDMRRKCDGERVTVGGGDRLVSESRPAGVEYTVCAMCTAIDDRARMSACAFALSEMFAVPVDVLMSITPEEAESISIPEVDEHEVSPKDAAFMVDAGLVDAPAVKVFDDWKWGRLAGFGQWHLWAVDDEVMIKACDRDAAPVRVSGNAVDGHRLNNLYNEGRANCSACRAVWTWVVDFEAHTELIRQRDEAIARVDGLVKVGAELAGEKHAYKVGARGQAEARARLEEECGRLQRALRDGDGARFLLEAEVERLNGVLAKVATVVMGTTPVVDVRAVTSFGRVYVHDVDSPLPFASVCGSEGCTWPTLMHRKTRRNAIEALAGHWAANHGTRVTVTVSEDGLVHRVRCSVGDCRTSYATGSRRDAVRDIVGHELREHPVTEES